MIHQNPIQLDRSPAAEKPVQSGVFRYGAIVPLAAVMTIGLTLTMAGLVATEFTPQDKTETAVFEINPVVEDILDPVRTLEIDPLQEVEVPPPPPTLDITKVAEVKVPIVPISDNLPDLGPLDFEIDSGLGESIIIDGEGDPIVRIPPIFPPRFIQGNNSGYCKVRFDVSAQGKPYNVQALTCTNRQLTAPTIKSVQRWNYRPKVKNGRPVARSGLETTIRFDLQDESGKVLPVPSGF